VLQYFPLFYQGLPLTVGGSEAIERLESQEDH
jgi:hypothetical protein